MTRATENDGCMTTITVGISGSDSTHTALDWAVDRALAVGAELELVHVVDVSWGAAPPEFLDTAVQAAEAQLHALEQLTRQANPELRVRTALQLGAPVAELAAAAEGCDLLVVGSHFAHRGAEHAATRRAARIAAAASCSVVVVPVDDAMERRGIVVGVDGSADSDAAVAFAAREADRYGEKLTVIYSWFAPQPWSTTGLAFVWPSEPRDEDRLIIAEAIGGLSQDYPDLEIAGDVVFDDPANGLLAASAHARLLVVGSRGRHGIAKMVLGSVSESVIWGLRSPVAVIR
jgi:nucleotide-binding universal stress UspA family protein